MIKDLWETGLWNVLLNFTIEWHSGQEVIDSLDYSNTSDTASPAKII